MLFIVLGVVVGVAVALGPLAFLSAPVDRFVNALVADVEHVLRSGLHGTPYLAHEPRLVTVLSVLIGVLAPGIAALGLAGLARVSVSGRRALSAIALVAGLAGLFVFPAKDSVPVLIGALVVGALASFLTGALVTAPLAGLATIIEVRYGVELWHGKSSAVAAGAHRLAHLVGGQAPLWSLALTVVALAPLVSAALLSIKQHAATKA